MTPPVLSWEVHTRSPGVPIFTAQAAGLTFEIYERPSEGTGRNRTPASFVLWHSGRPVMMPAPAADECKRHAQSILCWREVAAQPFDSQIDELLIRRGPVVAGGRVEVQIREVGT